MSALMPFSVSALVVAAFVSAPAQTDDVTIQQNVTYSSPNGIDLHLDIYSPASQAASQTKVALPAVLLIHGGAWTSLDKSTMSHMASFLARHDFIAFSVDYRLVQGKQNRWPAQLDDVQTAVRWVRANADKYNVRPERIGAFGHSAGAQLAALLGMEDTRDNSNADLAKYSSRVQAVVDVSGPADFTNIGGDPEGMEFLANFLGATYERHPNIWRDASPALHFSKHDANGLAAYLIFHGTQDQEVPISQSEELFKKLKGAGADVAFTKVNDAHTFQTPEARQQLTTGSLAFFKRTLSAPAN